MKYELIENYFQSDVMQNAVQTYFDTVLAELLKKHSMLEAKGLFIIDNKVLKNEFDMPYHIHILNGLIPSLLIYEEYLIRKKWIKTEEAELYIKTFILGYTFHDANKLLNIDTLNNAVKELDKIIDQYVSIKMFFPDFQKYKGNIYFLCLSDEDRTCVLANQYKITLSEIHLKEVLVRLCKFADSIASNQNFDSIETFYNSISKSLSIISEINTLPISYVKVNPNPYTLLSQNILQSARQVLSESGKKVFQSLRNGFVYFGEDLTETEVRKIQKRSQQVSGDINPLKLTKVSAQKCCFGFVGSVEFTYGVLEKIIDFYIDNFFSLSPNSKDTVLDFNDFVKFNEKLIDVYKLPIIVKIQNDRLYLNIDKERFEDWHKVFFKIYCLHKIQWLCANQNKNWRKDFEIWNLKNVNLISEIILNSDDQNRKIQIAKSFDLKKYIESISKTPSALLKIYLNIVKSHSVIIEKSEDEIQEYIKNLEDEIITSFTKEMKENNLINEFFSIHFTFKGNLQIEAFNNYNPQIPEKSRMCAFTGGIALKEYKEDVAFSMKARGFSNRSITSLNNIISHISDLYSEENLLRKSNFSDKDSNIVIYNDFFESTLDIDRDILTACIKAKNIKVLEDASIQFDKNAKFLYNLYNLNFDNIAPTIEANFYYVRKSLLMVEKLGIRSYITGIMSPYLPHKEVFRYENAPRFLKLLGWDKVRFIDVNRVLNEISLVLTLGNSQLDGNLLKISKSRNAYFSIYYLLKEDDKKKVYVKLSEFINNNLKLFTGMTVTEKLAELATKVKIIGYKSSGSEETGLIRVALDFVRKEVKQGHGREDVIQKICGSIYKTRRLDEYVDTEAIKDFSTAVFDELFIKEWKGQLPNLNREKDWIYQFAFVYKEISNKKIDLITSKKIKDKLQKEGKEISEQNIRYSLKDDNKEQYTDKFINLILNNQ
ncbi:MAG: hypothetical protein PHI48_05080 [Bacteroidales bacterium]|nr:hypothetical protein [Bacteroidales bacterium]